MRRLSAAMLHMINCAWPQVIFEVKSHLEAFWMPRERAVDKPSRERTTPFEVLPVDDQWVVRDRHSRRELYKGSKQRCEHWLDWQENCANPAAGLK